jgi:hypothetical protein
MRQESNLQGAEARATSRQVVYEKTTSRSISI